MDTVFLAKVLDILLNAHQGIWVVHGNKEGKSPAIEYLSFTWRWKCLFSTVLQPAALQTGHAIPSSIIVVATSGEIWFPQHNVRWGWSSRSFITGQMKSAGGSSAYFFFFGSSDDFCAVNLIIIRMETAHIIHTMVEQAYPSLKLESDVIGVDWPIFGWAPASNYKRKRHKHCQLIRTVMFVPFACTSEKHSSHQYPIE